MQRAERAPNNVCVSVVDRLLSSMHRRSFTCHHHHQQQQQSTVTSHAAGVSALITTVSQVTGSRSVQFHLRIARVPVLYSGRSRAEFGRFKIRRVDALQLNTKDVSRRIIQSPHPRRLLCNSIVYE